MSFRRCHIGIPFNEIVYGYVRKGFCFCIEVLSSELDFPEERFL
jgi:hypothetical protein